MLFRQLGECEDELNQTKEMVKELQEQLRELQAKQSSDSRVPGQHADDNTVADVTTIRSDGKEQESDTKPEHHLPNEQDSTDPPSVDTTGMGAEEVHRRRRSTGRDHVGHDVDQAHDAAEHRHHARANAVGAEVGAPAHEDARASVDTHADAHRQHGAHVQNGAELHHGGRMSADVDVDVGDPVHARAHEAQRDTGTDGAASSHRAKADIRQQPVEQHTQHHHGDKHAMPAAMTRAHGMTHRDSHEAETTAVEVAHNGTQRCSVVCA